MSPADCAAAGTPERWIVDARGEAPASRSRRWARMPERPASGAGDESGLTVAEPESTTTAVRDGDLVAVSVLSGNRDFEGRISPDVKANYLASPPLVVAYALAEDRAGAGCLGDGGGTGCYPSSTDGREEMIEGPKGRRRGGGARVRAWSAGLLLLATAPWVLGARPAAGASQNPLAPQEARLVPADSEPGDTLGWSVAVDGTTVVAGAPKDASGTVSVFEPDPLDPGAWLEMAKITDISQGGADFGWAVDVDGDTLVASAPYDDTHGVESGAYYVFGRDVGGADHWGLVAEVFAGDAAPLDKFGWDLALSADTVIVGALLEDDACAACPDAGAAYVFERDRGGPDAWGQAAKLVASDAAPLAHFGTSVTIDGDRAVVGASGSNTAYVFERDAGGSDGWGEVRRLPDRFPGEVRFGSSVALDDTTLLVGAPSAAGAEVGSGAAYLFARGAGGVDGWGEIARLSAPGGEQGDDFGRRVALRGRHALIGAWREDEAVGDLRVPFAGAAYLYRRQGQAWQGVVRLTAGDVQPGDRLGGDVDLAGDTLLVGAPEGDAMAPERAGAAYVFRGVLVGPLALSLTGECPGSLTVEIADATPSSPVALIRGSGLGASLVPFGACEDTFWELAEPSPLGTLLTDGDGRLAVRIEAPAELCGTPLEAADEVTCASSPAARVP